VALLALLVAPLAARAASGLPPTITITPESVEPGAQIQVAGLDFPAGQTVELQLTTTAGAVHLGTASVEEGGYFRQPVTLPADVAPGFWELRASAPDGSVAVLIVEAGEASPALAAPQEAAPAPAASGSASGTDAMVLLVLALLATVVGGSLAYARYLSRHDGRQPGMSAGDDPIWSGATSDT
jgi:hypothetical protein